MKHIIYILFFLFTISDCRADIPEAIVKRYKEIIRLIKNDKAKELAALVQYPLKRQNPLPDISDAKAFISYYKILIDNKLKQKIKLFNDTDIFEHHGQYGLVGGPFNGDIWIDDTGKITGINFHSEREKELRAQLTKNIQSKIHPSVNSWKENVLVLKSEKLLIRVDNTSKGFRYVSWSKGHKMSEKPDLILYNGVEEAQGTQGGWTWTFKNGDWTYVVDDVEMCSTDDDCGYFLRLLFKGADKSSIKLKETK